MRLYLLAAVLASSAAAADGEMKPFTVGVKEIDAKVKILKVDADARTVTIKGPGGKKVTLDVPGDVSDVARYKEGSWAKARYVESIVLAAAKPGIPSASEEELIHLQPTGGSRQVTVDVKRLTAQVIDVDLKERELKVRADGGITRTLKIAPSFPDLGSVKVGDTISMEYTEAVALELNEANP